MSMDIYDDDCAQSHDKDVPQVLLNEAHAFPMPHIHLIHKFGQRMPLVCPLHSRYAVCCIYKHNCELLEQGHLHFAR